MSAPNALPEAAATETAIIAILADKAWLAPAEIGPDMALADLGLDSLGMVEAIFAIEETFDISMPLAAGQAAEAGADTGASLDTSTVAALIAEVKALIAQKAA